MSINDGKTCPYCNSLTQYVDSFIVYGRSYGMIYYCKPCHAWVGVHKGSSVALGRLANSELREAKKEAHKYFDSIWKTKILNRKESYKWLTEQLKIEPKECHIGMFDVERCKEAIEVCKEKLKQ